MACEPSVFHLLLSRSGRRFVRLMVERTAPRGEFPRGATFLTRCQALLARVVFFAGVAFFVAVFFAAVFFAAVFFVAAAAFLVAVLLALAVTVFLAGVLAAAVFLVVRGAFTGSASLTRSAPRTSRRNLPVWLAGTPATSSGVPSATTRPPPAPPSGPMSTSQSRS